MGEEWGCEVIALAVDVGQGGDFETIRKRALAAGAVEAEVIDARARYAEGFVVPAVRANALYEGRYPLVSALSRPVTVEELVAAARRHGGSLGPAARRHLAPDPAAGRGAAGAVGGRDRLRVRRPRHARRRGAARPRADREAGREGRRLRVRPDRHGGEPPGRHQEPG